MFERVVYVGGNDEMRQSASLISFARCSGGLLYQRSTLLRSVSILDSPLVTTSNSLGVK